MGRQEVPNASDWTSPSSSPALSLPVCRMGGLGSEVRKGLPGAPVSLPPCHPAQQAARDVSRAPCSLSGAPRVCAFVAVPCFPSAPLPLLSASAPLPGSGPLLARLGSEGTLTSKSTWPRSLPLGPSDLAHHGAGRGRAHSLIGAPCCQVSCCSLQGPGYLLREWRAPMHPAFTCSPLRSFTQPFLSACCVPGVCRGQPWPCWAGEGRSGSRGETSAGRPS